MPPENNHPTSFIINPCDNWSPKNATRPEICSFPFLWSNFKQQDCRSRIHSYHLSSGMSTNRHIFSAGKLEMKMPRYLWSHSPYAFSCCAFPICSQLTFQKHFNIFAGFNTEIRSTRITRINKYNDYFINNY